MMMSAGVMPHMSQCRRGQSKQTRSSKRHYRDCGQATSTNETPTKHHANSITGGPHSTGLVTSKFGFASTI